MFGSRYFNNVLNTPTRLPKNAVVANNRIQKDAQFRDATAGDFRLKGQMDSKIGAFAPNGLPWKAGCDLKNPPNPLPTLKPSKFPWMNLVKNACFEFGTLEGWTPKLSARAELVRGNDWGNDWGKANLHATGTSKFELKLGPGKGGVEQIIKGLSPNTEYQLSAWMRTSDEKQTASIGIKGGEIAVSSSTKWTRKSVTFTTGPTATEVTIFLWRKSGEDGSVWFDNVTLPMTPPAK